MKLWSSEIILKASNHCGNFLFIYLGKIQYELLLFHGNKSCEGMTDEKLTYLRNNLKNLKSLRSISLYLSE